MVKTHPFLLLEGALFLLFLDQKLTESSFMLSGDGLQDSMPSVKNPARGRCNMDWALVLDNAAKNFPPPGSRALRP